MLNFQRPVHSLSCNFELRASLEMIAQLGRPCESRDPYAVASREPAAYGSRRFGRDDTEPSVWDPQGNKRVIQTAKDPCSWRDP